MILEGFSWIIGYFDFYRWKIRISNEWNLKKSESSEETCRNWIANWIKFQRIKISDLQEFYFTSGRRPKCGGVYSIFPMMNYPRGEHVFLPSVLFLIRRNYPASRVVFFCTVLAAGIQALGVFFKGYLN